VGLVWNRAWPRACALRPEPLPPAADNGALAAVDLDCYAPLFFPPPAGAGAGAGVAVFVPTAALRGFFANVWPSVDAAWRVVLVTGLADAGPAAALGAPRGAGGGGGGGRWDAPPPPGGPPPGAAAAAAAAAAAPLAAALADARLAAWFAENLDFAHAKAAALPLGVDFHTLAYKPGDRPGWGPPAPPAAQARTLAETAARARPPAARDPRVFVHFGVLNRRRAALLAAVARAPAFALHPAMAAVAEGARGGGGGGGGGGGAPRAAREAVPRGLLWATMAGYRWVASVEGYGLDCHREWRARRARGARRGAGAGAAAGHTTHTLWHTTTDD